MDKSSCLLHLTCSVLLNCFLSANPSAPILNAASPPIIQAMVHSLTLFHIMSTPNPWPYTPITTTPAPLLLWNCRSITNKLKEFQVFVYSRSLIALTETRLPDGLLKHVAVICPRNFCDPASSQHHNSGEGGGFTLKKKKSL